MDDRAARVGLKSDRKVTARRPWVIVLVLVLLGLAIWGAWALAHGARSGGGAPGAFGRRGGRPPTTVGVAQATRADIPVTLDALGTVTPVATVTVRPQVGGVVTQILFREGQMVKKGQTLAVIDPRPLQMALLQAQGNLTRDEAQLANARLQLKRYQTLLAQDSIARQDVDTQAATAKQLEGTVMTDRAAVGAAKLNLEWSRVAAPFDGRVGLRIADVGALVAANDANGVVVETQVAPIDVQFTVPQDQAPEVAARARQGTLTVAALDSTRAKTLATGTFTTLDNQVDPTTGTVRAKARFGNADGVLFPNQFVNVRVTLNTLKNAVVTPLSALRTGPNGDFVWIMKPDQTVTMRSVKRGQTTPTQVVILSGLAVGERVVTDGGDRLTEGAKVMLPGQMRGGHGGKGRRGQAGGGDSTQGPAPATPAAGQPSAQASAGGDGQSGGFAPSPEMRAARQAARQACAADVQKLCAGAEGREAMMCLRQNAGQVSEACKAALAKLPHRAPNGDQGGGEG